jgi:hypothetical protein
MKIVKKIRDWLSNSPTTNKKFTDDVWGIIARELEGKIEPNFTVYGEIVGHTPSGKMIQRGYDYGANPMECEFLVYRITYNLSESVSELDFDEIEEFCEENRLKTVPVYYKGRASDLFDIPKDEKWHDNFLSALKEKYLDKTCELCTTGVVNEGVVLRRENNPKRTALKFKSPQFLIKESTARDNNEEDMEEDA